MRVIAISCVVAAVLIGAGTADAATVCVPVAVAGCDSAAGSPQAAADEAAEGDVVRIAAGGFPGVATTKRLTFAGAGAGATVLSGTAAAPSAMRLDHGGIVRGLQARGAPGSAANASGAAIRVFVDDPTSHDLTLEDVIARGGAAGDQWAGASGVDVTHLSGSSGAVVPTIVVRGGEILGGDGEAFVGIPPGPGEPPYFRKPDPALFLNGRLFAATITGTLVRGGGLRGVPGARADGVYIYGGQLALVRVTAEGGRALSISHAGTKIDHSTLSGQTAGLEVRPNGVAMMGPTELVDSLVSAVPVAGQSAPAAAAVYAPLGTEQVVARGSTFFGRGAVAAGYAQHAAGGSGTVATILRNTLVLNLGSAAGAVDLLAGTGSVDPSHSAYRTYRLSGGAVAPAPGSATNVAASPLVDTRLVPLPRSSLIDAGDPGVVAPGEVDRTGLPRSADGDGDCTARPDIGAFERPAARCNPAPSVSAFGATRHRFAPERRRSRGRAARTHAVARGTRFRFRLSERALVAITVSRVLPGRRAGPRCVAPTRRNRHARACVRIRRLGVLRDAAHAGRDGLRFSGRLHGRPLPQGLYRATIVARDALGARSRPRSVRFRIVRPGRPRA